MKIKTIVKQLNFKNTWNMEGYLACFSYFFVGHGCIIIVLRTHKLDDPQGAKNMRKNKLGISQILNEI